MVTFDCSERLYVAEDNVWIFAPVESKVSLIIPSILANGRIFGRKYFMSGIIRFETKNEISHLIFP